MAENEQEKIGWWGVHAFESIYGGMHGINSKFVFYGTEKEAWRAYQHDH